MQTYNFSNKIEQMFPNTSQEMRQLMVHLLQFNPTNRMTAAELTKLEMFNDLQDFKNDEQPEAKY